jgi:hypothetical protein
MAFAQTGYYNPNLEIFDDGFPWRETRFQDFNVTDRSHMDSIAL